MGAALPGSGIEDCSVQTGDKEWVVKAAKLVRDTKRTVDREFAKSVLRELREQQRRSAHLPKQTD